MIAFALSAVVTLVLPAIILSSASGDFPMKGYAIGVAVSVLNGICAYATNRLSIGREVNTFLLRSLLGHGTRLALILGFIMGSILNETPQLRALLITLCVGYFSFLFSEIAMLYSRQYSSRSIFTKTEF